MKLYKIKIKFKPFHIYPFEFLYRWKSKIDLILFGWELKLRFKRLNWSESEVWSMTDCCGSLNEAITKLSHILTDNKKLLPLARELIDAGFEREWK